MKFLQKLYHQIEKWIQNLNRVQKSVILTLISLFFILLLLTVVQLRNGKSEELIEVISTDEEFIDVEEVKKQELEKKWEDFLNNAKATTKSYNEADRKLRHTEEDFKTLDDILEERKLKQTSEEVVNTSEGDFKITEKKQKAKDKDFPEDSQKDKVNKNSYVRYNLQGRYPLYPLPNPIYTCDASGKIVINITVNSEGIVVGLNFNSKESTSNNGCLVENALSYTRNAKFNVDTKKRKQSGTITYYFQGR